MQEVREGTNNPFLSVIHVLYLYSFVFLQKLSKVAAPDPFTASSDSIKAGSRKVGEMKLGKKTRYSVSRRAFSPHKGPSFAPLPVGLQRTLLSSAEVLPSFTNQLLRSS